MNKKLQIYVRSVSSHIACSGKADRAKFAKKYEQVDDEFRENVASLLSNISIGRYLLFSKHLYGLLGHTMALVVNLIIKKYADGFLDSKSVDLLEKYLIKNRKITTKKGKDFLKDQFKTEFKNIDDLFINSIEPTRRKILCVLFETIRWIDKKCPNSQTKAKSMINSLYRCFYSFDKYKKRLKSFSKGFCCTSKKKKRKRLVKKMIFVRELTKRLYIAHFNGKFKEEHEMNSEINQEVNNK